jgi:hypothetical protein
MGTTNKIYALILTLIISISCLTLLNVKPTTAQTPSDLHLGWSKTYGYIGAYGVSQNAAGNYFVAIQQAQSYGYYGHLLFDYPNTNGKLLTLDANGNVVDNKTLPLLPAAMIPINGGYTIVGVVEHFVANLQLDTGTQPLYQKVAALTKIDENGSVMWNYEYPLLNQTLGSMNTVIVNFMVQTEDGGYIFGGGTNLNGYISAYLIRTNSAGQTLWMKTYGNSSAYMNEFITRNNVASIVQTPDGGFLLVGVVDGNSLVKIDSDGNFQWGRDYFFDNYGDTGAFNYTVYGSISRTKDGSYIIAGVNTSNEKSVAFLAELDTNYNQLWNRTYELGYQFGSPLVLRESVSDGYLFSSQSLLLKTNDNFSPVWIENLNGTINQAVITKDGEVVAVGTALSNPDSMIATTFVWVTKLDNNPNSPPPSSTASIAPTANPSIPELSWLAIVPLLLSVPVAVIVRHRKVANLAK